MYQLTNDVDVIKNVDSGFIIPRGHRLWDEYEVWLADGNSPSPISGFIDINQAKLTRQKDATAARWEHETGGIELGGVYVGTTLDDQNRISGVLSAIALGGLESVDFKAANGWVQLSASELQGIAQAISTHVQACFSAERLHHEEIDKLSSIDDVVNYDVSTGWPQ